MKILYKTIFLFFVNYLLLSIPLLVAQNIAAGGFHSLSLCSDGTVKAWGFNQNGQLGNGTEINSNTPVSVSSLTDISAVAAGENHSMALKKDGTVWAWGWNTDGVLGDGTTLSSSNIPIQVKLLTGIIAISAGKYHSLALKDDGTVWAWGHAPGNGKATNSTIPEMVSSLTGIVAIAAGKNHFSLALKNDGTVWAWGSNTEGHLGNGTYTDSYIPIQINSLSDIIAIKAGYDHALALKNDGTVWAWGNNGHGELGDGTSSDQILPVMLKSISDVSSIAIGNSHSFAIKKDGTVYGWGLGSGYQYGVSSSNAPMLLSFLTNISSISGGAEFSEFLKKDGTVYTIGSNLYGQLGMGKDTPKFSGDLILVNGLCFVATTVNDLIKPFDFSMYPNPSHGIVHMAFSEPVHNAKLLITNITGQVIFTGKLESNQTTININQVNKGIYIVIVENNKVKSTQKLIIE